MSEERVGDEGALPVGSVEKGDRGGYGGGSGDDSIGGSGGGDSVGAWRVLVLPRDVRDRGNKGSR